VKPHLPIGLFDFRIGGSLLEPEDGIQVSLGLHLLDPLDALHLFLSVGPGRRGRRGPLRGLALAHIRLVCGLGCSKGCR
jgi:hypothetical protein